MQQSTSSSQQAAVNKQQSTSSSQQAAVNKQQSTSSSQQHRVKRLGSKKISKFNDQNYLLYLSQAIKFHLVKISTSEKLKQKLPGSI